MTQSGRSNGRGLDSGPIMGLWLIDQLVCLEIRIFSIFLMKVCNKFSGEEILSNLTSKKVCAFPPFSRQFFFRM